MSTLSLSYTLFRSFPESIIILSSFMILLNIKIEFKELFKTSIISWLCVSCIRLLPISFGVHTVLGMCVYMMAINKTFKNKPIKIVIAACKVFIALALSEGIYFAIATSILNLPSERLTNTTSLDSAFVTLPSLVILILIVIIFKRTEIYIKKR